jgi:hypothetical protein
MIAAQMGSEDLFEFLPVDGEALVQARAAAHA